MVPDRLSLLSDDMTSLHDRSDTRTWHCLAAASLLRGQAPKEADFAMVVFVACTSEPASHATKAHEGHSCCLQTQRPACPALKVNSHAPGRTGYRCSTADALSAPGSMCSGTQQLTLHHQHP